MMPRTKRIPPFLLVLVFITFMLAACGLETAEQLTPDNRQDAIAGDGGDPGAEHSVTDPVVVTTPGEDSSFDDETGHEPTGRTGGDVEQTVESEANEEQPGRTEENRASSEGASPSDTDGEPGASEEIAMFTVDDRTERQRLISAGWNTDFGRHTVPYEELVALLPVRDGIPAIDAPSFISIEEAADWLADNEPVISIEFDGDARAYPLQILTWHEIVNDTVGGIPVIVTFCPLCNAALVFDRRVDGEVYDFGTSGWLRHSDLVMYDRATESLWQQFTGEGIVGELAGEQLEFLPSSIISFANFRQAYPGGMVLSRDTGFDRPYGQNPYPGYDRIGEDPFAFVGIPDRRLAAMERVVTVSLGAVDVAYPLTVLSEAGVINDTQDGQDLVVFHVDGTASALDAPSIFLGEDVGATGVFDPILDEQTLAFFKEGSLIMDKQTGSTWNIAGQAVDGPLTGAQLVPIVHGDHFWFAWAAFKPDTIIYGS